jgi:AbrB family looped-hinge helix DNA binding protein
MSKILGASKVSSKFQVTIPEDVCKTLGIAVGDIIVFSEVKGKVSIVTK